MSRSDARSGTIDGEQCKKITENDFAVAVRVTNWKAGCGILISSRKLCHSMFVTLKLSGIVVNIIMCCNVHHERSKLEVPHNVTSSRQELVRVAGAQQHAVPLASATCQAKFVCS